MSLSACVTMAPDYERPEAPVPESISYTAEDVDEGSLVSWRAVFADPKLAALIETALANNRDLRVTALNVERARALYRVQRSESFPSVGASGNYRRTRIGENASTGFVGDPTTPGSGTPGGGPFTFEEFSAQADLSAYELDLFGRIRSLNREALELYFATDEARKAAEIALVAELAGAYLQLAGDRELLAVARDTVESQQLSLDLTTKLVENGLGTDLDVERARSAIERARADAARFTAEVARDENALRLLIGAKTHPDLGAPRGVEEVGIRREIPAGVSSAILLERPDVRAAERGLRAANANIGAARAAFFPRILLTASAGTQSTELANLFSAGTGVWSFAPSISIPIFEGGRNRANLARSKVDRDIARAEYEGAIQTAFREVADALATRETIDERIEATENLAEATAHAFELSEARFRNGVDGYLAVLDAQRENYAARRELVEARLAEAANVVALYRALGGDGKGG